MNAEERFWAKVAKTAACWLWTGAHGGSHAAYGVFGPTHATQVYAHRYSWELAYGPLPPGALVLHRCDTPACVRPDHLFSGTVADNIADKVQKGRQQRGERAGGARLTNAQAAALRADASGMTGVQLSDKYGISRASVSRILNRRRYTVP